MTSRRRAVVLAGVLLALTGAGLAGQGGYIHAKAWAAQILMAHAWNRTLAGEAEAKPWPWADSWPVARLSLPDHGIEQFVLSEASGRALAFGPGHLPQSAQPGGAGASIIAGHRDTHFRFLRDIRPGDRIEVETADGAVHRFRASAHYVLPTPDLTLDPAVTEPRLILATCWPFDGVSPRGTERYVLMARQ
ncbi:MAG: class GN sortase [Minwuiales bacterium]|nr:class GN sortase [Minwuiales bacterium]